VTPADTPRRLRRIVRDLRAEGPARLAAEYARRWRRATRGRAAVFEWRAEAPPEATEPASAGDQLWLGRYAAPADVPPAFYRAAEAEEGPAALDRFLDLFLSAAVLWVPWLAGRPAGYLWTSRDDARDAGHLPSQSETTRLFSVATFRPFRGRRVAGRTAAEVCRREVAAGGRAVAEAFAWDAAAVRTLEAAGFRRVDVAKDAPPLAP